MDAVVKAGRSSPCVAVRHVAMEWLGLARRALPLPARGEREEQGANRRVTFPSRPSSPAEPLKQEVAANKDQ